LYVASAEVASPFPILGEASRFLHQSGGLTPRPPRIRNGAAMVARRQWRQTRTSASRVMWGRLFFGFVLLIALTAGYPYAALLLHRVIGTSTVAFMEADGTQRTLIMGPDAPRPDWLPILPRSMVVSAGHWLPSADRLVAGDIALLTHKGVDDIKRFYLDGLRAAGFDVRDAGIAPLNAPTAEYLGIANSLLGWHGEKRLWISVRTRTPGGLVAPSRTVEIHWQTRETPLFPSTPPPSPG
jgi:hypothetical protein